MPPPATTQSAARLWTARVVQLRHAAPGEYQPTRLPRIPTKCRDNGNCTVCSWLKLAINDPASCKIRFTRGRVRELKNDHNSVTVQNRTHVYMNFFHHKDLGNHLLQLCPKVVKHPVCCAIYDVLSATVSDEKCFKLHLYHVHLELELYHYIGKMFNCSLIWLEVHTNSFLNSSPDGNALSDCNPDILTPRNKPLYQLNRRLCGPQSRSGRFGEE